MYALEFCSNVVKQCFKANIIHVFRNIDDRKENKKKEELLSSYLTAITLSNVHMFLVKFG